MDLWKPCIGLFLVGLITIASGFKFPLDITRCPVGDNDCIVKSGNKVIELNAKLGHNGINLIPLDPLHIPSLYIKQGAESPVNIELRFKDVDLVGLSNLRFSKISGFQSNPVGKYQLKGKGTKLYLVGPYQISGRVLILPIQGDGDNNITLSDPELTFNFDGKSFKRNGKEYLKVENPSLTFTVTNIRFDFKNLYKGDKALGDSTNLFLNENWNDIFGEIKDPIFKAFTLIAENALTNVFNKVPYKELFADA